MFIKTIHSDWYSGQSRGQFYHSRPQRTYSSMLNGENHSSINVLKFIAYPHKLRRDAVVNIVVYCTEDLRFYHDSGWWKFQLWPGDQSTDIFLVVCFRWEARCFSSMWYLPSSVIMTETTVSLQSLWWWVWDSPWWWQFHITYPYRKYTLIPMYPRSPSYIYKHGQSLTFNH